MSIVAASRRGAYGAVRMSSGEKVAHVIDEGTVRGRTVAHGGAAYGKVTHMDLRRGPAKRDSVMRRRLVMRRRRAVLLVVMSAIALGVGYLIGSVTSASASEGENVSVITVQPGDTLWSLAESVSEPGEDIRETILEIGEINGLTSSSIQAGQRLLLPSQP